MCNCIGKSTSGEAVCSSDYAEDGGPHCPILLSAHATGLQGDSGIYVHVHVHVCIYSVRT